MAEARPGVGLSGGARLGPCQLHLLGAALCITLSYMKDAALTIRLDPALERQLEAVARASGRTKSEVVRDALRRRILPFAEARGYLTDEDVYRDVS